MTEDENNSDISDLLDKSRSRSRSRKSSTSKTNSNLMRVKRKITNLYRKQNTRKSERGASPLMKRQTTNFYRQDNIHGSIQKQETHMMRKNSFRKQQKGMYSRQSSRMNVHEYLIRQESSPLKRKSTDKLQTDFKIALLHKRGEQYHTHSKIHIKSNPSRARLANQSVDLINKKDK